MKKTKLEMLLIASILCQSVSIIMWMLDTCKSLTHIVWCLECDISYIELGASNMLYKTHRPEGELIPSKSAICIIASRDTFSPFWRRPRRKMKASKRMIEIYDNLNSKGDTEFNTFNIRTSVCFEFLPLEPGFGCAKQEATTSSANSDLLHKSADEIQKV